MHAVCSLLCKRLCNRRVEQARLNRAPASTMENALLPRRRILRYACRHSDSHFSPLAHQCWFHATHRQQQLATDMETAQLDLFHYNTAKAGSFDICKVLLVRSHTDAPFSSYRYIDNSRYSRLNLLFIIRDLLCILQILLLMLARSRFGQNCDRLPFSGRDR